jgi:C1A family cysteine protease
MKRLDAEDIIANYDPEFPQQRPLSAGRTFVIRNLWSTSWGIKGYCLMPYEYFLNSQLAIDFGQFGR